MHPLVQGLFRELASGKAENAQTLEPNYPGPSRRCAASCVNLGNLLSSLATVTFFVKWDCDNLNLRGLLGSPYEVIFVTLWEQRSALLQYQVSED